MMARSIARPIKATGGGAKNMEIQTFRLRMDEKDISEVGTKHNKLAIR